MRFLFRLSKWLHKYLGLFLLIYFVAEGASGILLNHPDLLRDLSVSKRFIPPSYQLNAWNRGALRSMLYSSKDPQTAFAWGYQGVWKSNDGGKTFSVMDQGFPASAQGRRTHDLLLLEGPTDQLLAATDNGLFLCELQTEQWRHLPLGEDEKAVRRILLVKDKILVFSASHAYATPVDDPFRFEAAPLKRKVPDHEMSLVQFFFELHSGAIWGLPGRLLFDFAGLILIFISLSGLYLWYFPWRKKRSRRKKGKAGTAFSRAYHFMYTYHLKLGIWIAILFLLIGFTGLFMRPPLVMALLNKSIPKSLYPAQWPSNPWHDAIHNACYNPIEDTLCIEAQGFWEGPADFSEAFEKSELAFPSSPMGTTIFDCDREGNYLVASFSGLWRINRRSASPEDLIENEDYINKRSFFKFMVSGYFETPEKEAFVVGHADGLKGLGGAAPQGRFTMPEDLLARYRMPLWSYLFELHNGRLFRDYLGSFYLLIPIMGALLFLLVTLSGIYDWSFRKLGRRCNKAEKRPFPVHNATPDEKEI